MRELDLEPIGLDQRRLEILVPGRKHRAQEVVRDPADRFLPGPAVEKLRATVPIGDDIVHIAHEHRVMGEIEKARLLAQHFRRGLALQGEEGCERDREDADEAPDEGWPMGEAMLEQEAQCGDGDARPRDEQQPATLHEAASHQHHDCIENRDGKPQWRERIDDEDRDRKGDGDGGEHHACGKLARAGAGV
jgi:hypothetical protein